MIEFFRPLYECGCTSPGRRPESTSPTASPCFFVHRSATLDRPPTIRRREPRKSVLISLFAEFSRHRRPSPGSRVRNDPEANSGCEKEPCMVFASRTCCKLIITNHESKVSR